MATNYEYLEQFLELHKGADWDNNIPELTKTNIAEVGNAIIDYQPARDMFYNAFIVKITNQLFAGLIADNKFKFLKGQKVVGDIEDSYVDYIEGKNFDPDDETLLANVKADIKTLYHKLDRKLVYETSISDVQLRNAMLSEGGLDSLVSTILSTLTNSKEWDEFTMVKQLIVDNFAHAGKVVIIEGDVREDILKNFLRALRKTSNKMTYVNREHNEVEVATATPKKNQLLVLHDDLTVDIDFDVLANIYNMNKLEIETRTVTVDNFNEGIVTITGEDDSETDYEIIAGLFDVRAFRINDVLNHTETFRNPQTLTTKYFLHIWQIMSMAFFFNMVYFVVPEGALDKEDNE